MKKVLLFIGFYSFFSIGFAPCGTAQEASDLVPDGGVPGQIDPVSGGSKIYFESQIHVEWIGDVFTLIGKDLKRLSFSLSGTAIPQTAREKLGEKVEEQDLGGTLKKNAPLAYKNPKVRTIKLPQGGDPLKTSGMQPMKEINEKTPEGGSLVTVQYADESKSISYQLKFPFLKEESSYNKKGDLIWRNIETDAEGYRVKKTQWEDGSVIREYTNKAGTLSVTYDNERNIYHFAFLNSKREVIREANCQEGVCEES